jgi:hypothetical protein
LKSLKVYNVGDDGSRYYRIDKVEFEKRFPRDVPAVRTFFSDDYDITKTISFALDPTGNEITIYQRWQCTGANDYNINDISTLFTPEKLAVFARFLSDVRVPGHTVLRYTFERPTPSTLFVPPVSLKSMFDIIQRDISRKPIAKRAIEIEDDVREPVTQLPKRADIFSRPPSARVGRAVTRAAIERVSPKPAPVLIASKPPAKRIHREPSPKQVDARVISKSPAKRVRKVTPGRQAARVVTPGRRLFRVSPKRSARKAPERKQGWGTYFKNMLGLNMQESQRRGKGYRDIGY